MVTPLGPWSRFELGRALTRCRQSQRKCHKFSAKERGGQSVTPLGRWKKGKHKSATKHGNSSGAMDCYITVQEYWKRLTYLAELPLIVLVVTVSVLLPDTYIPPPCEGKDDFSGFATLQRGDGVWEGRVSQSIQRGDGPLRNGSRILDAAHSGCGVVPDCAGDEIGRAAPNDGDTTTLQRRHHFSELT
eukprot:3810191-Prymnesium_polylepis.1